MLLSVFLEVITVIPFNLRCIVEATPKMSGKSKPYSAPGYGTSTTPPSYSSNGKKGSDSTKSSDNIYNYSSGGSEAGPIYGGVPFFKTFNGVRLQQYYIKWPIRAFI